MLSCFALRGTTNLGRGLRRSATQQGRAWSSRKSFSIRFSRALPILLILCDSCECPSRSDGPPVGWPGRRVACAKSGSAFAQNDTLSYGYNEKSELTNAVAAVDSNCRYAYGFDDIGNRETSFERGTNSIYALHPEVNLGPLPGEGRGRNHPSLDSSQSLQGVNYH